MLFPNMKSETFYLFFLERSERIFERSAKLACAANKQAVAIPVCPIGKVQKTVEFRNFIERTILYKCGLDLKCSFYTSETISNFSGTTFYIRRDYTKNSIFQK
jgi:hypothetical protein